MFENKHVRTVTTDILKIQSLTRDNDSCENRFTPQEEISYFPLAITKRPYT